MGLWSHGRAETSNSVTEHLLSMRKALASFCGTTKREVEGSRGVTSPNEEDDELLLPCEQTSNWMTEKNPYWFVDVKVIK